MVGGGNFLCSTGCWKALCCPQSKPWSCIVYLLKHSCSVMSSNWDCKSLRFLVGCPSDGAACLEQVLSNSRLKLSGFSFQKLFLGDGFALQLKESKFSALSAGKIPVMENCVNILFPSPPVPRKLPHSPGLKASPVLRPIYKKYCPACWHTPMGLSEWGMLQGPDTFHFITHKHQIHFRY